MDAIALCAAGEAAWHAVAYAGLGARWRRDVGLAWAPEGSPHRYLLTAVTLAPRPFLPRALVDGSGSFCDSYAALSDVPGWTPERADPWMLRPSGLCDIVPVAGVTVSSTTDELLFEHTAFLAAGGAPPQHAGELHPVGSSSVPGLTLLLAYRNDVPIGTALAVRHASGVVVSGVAVLESERGRGVGAALTAAAVNTAPDAPATLAASALGLGVYRRLGFEELARPIHWHRG